MAWASLGPFLAPLGLAQAFQGLNLASQVLAWSSLGLDWASLSLAQASGGDGRTNERTDGISPHSTGLRPLLRLLHELVMGIKGVSI